MSGFFEFLKVGNLLVFLVCLLALYYSINLVIYYYAPTSTPFVNMYFLYYIFFIITLLISVACSNYIEMTDDSSGPSLTSSTSSPSPPGSSSSSSTSGTSSDPSS
jgi:UDP-N-acetylmuramyl pentapeptide phosphotransferase/UDP-N-acetylglucosamine-1-phosphate transferase